MSEAPRNGPVFQYFLNRLTVAVLVAVTVSVFAFALLRMSGDLAAELAGDDATAADIERTAKLYGLDRPLYVQYFDWAGKALTGDLGESIFSSAPVWDIISDAAPVTIKLNFMALVVAVLVAVPLGVLAAIRQNTWIDRSCLAFAVGGQAIPNFWLALMMILVFGVMLRWLPISGVGTWAHWVMPTTVMAVAAMPILMRLTRAGMLEVLQADFIRTAQAKGLDPSKVFFKHALRNAILPVVSIAMVTFGRLIAIAVVVEAIFALNGLGFEVFRGIQRQDFPVVQSIVAFIAFIYIGLTLLSDLFNAQLDPRIRLS